MARRRRRHITARDREIDRENLRGYRRRRTHRRRESRRHERWSSRDHPRNRYGEFIRKR